MKYKSPLAKKVLFLKIIPCIFMIILSIASTTSQAETIKNFLDSVNGNNKLLKSNMLLYWRGVLDTTMYLFDHRELKINQRKDDAVIICPPKKYPSQKDFLEFYSFMIGVQITKKGDEATQKMEVDQIMMQMWYVLFNCDDPHWTQ